MNTFVRSFVFPFVIALLIFSTIALIFVPPTLDLIFSEKEGTDSQISDGESNDSSSASKIKSDATGSLSLLLIGTDEIMYSSTPTSPAPQPSGPQVPSVPTEEDLIKEEFDKILDKQEIKPSKSIEFLTLVTFDSSFEKVTITAIPVESYVYVRETKATMDAAYYYIESSMFSLDKSFYADFVTSVTGCYVDFYAYIDIDDYVSIADKLGGIPVMLDEDAACTDENGNVIYSYAHGAQSITSKQLRDIIKHDGFSSVFTKTNLLNQVSKYVLEKRTTTGYYMEFDNKFNEIYSKLYDTNLTLDDFSKHVPLFFSYGFYTPSALNVIGDLSVSSGTVHFTVNKESTIKLFKQK